ncbi:uncharacterized protein LOC121810577 [Salvia splendens]|uniref:uncharacterized protein LOC121810577 n=1 Tax=Salvia splendens TaxID=180675 RepID=UPI001C2758AE|nr:uncharacterized protein LOC121810577 [Salvia splendens]
MCIDYRKLNQATKKDHFPLPFIDQMLKNLVGKQYFSFLDGYSGYFQIAVNPDDQEKTTFTCPFGIYAYRRMPFGLCNTPGTFQRCMMSIFADLLEDCIEIFMDDFTVYGDDFDQGLHNLNKPLTRLLQNDVEFELSDICKIAFQFLKDRLISSPIIRAPDWNHPFEAQRNYDVTEKEMLSVVFAFEKFRPYLLGSKVIVTITVKPFQTPSLVKTTSECQWVNQMEEVDQAEQGSKEQHTRKEPWFADMANYLVTGELPGGDEVTRAQKIKLKRDSRYFYWDHPYLWKMGADQVIRRCIPKWEQEDVMIHCHALACGGHFGAKKTSRKILDSGFYWSSIHKDAYEFCKRCPRCQLTGGISTRNEMPQIPIIVCEIFDVWGMDFMGPFSRV